MTFSERFYLELFSMVVTLEHFFALKLELERS